MGEPWSFDCHLVLFKRYDRSVSLSNMEFRLLNFGFNYIIFLFGVCRCMWLKASRRL